jgi:tetratricopeptide (TPR) repeat protein
MNRIKYILAIGLLLSTTITFGQDFLSTDDARYQTIKKVYERLSNASGNGHTLPSLYIEQLNYNHKIIAYYDEENHIIVTEVELYDLLVQKYGDRVDDALAIVLGHELAHFYQHHTSGHNCVGYNAEAKNQEKEADKQGLYYTFQAGYQTADIAVDVIKEIYKFYQLSDGGSCGYPTLEDRINSMNEAIAEVFKSVEIYKTANFLMMLQEYQKAAILYEYIAKSFPTAEILNNIGVAYARMGIKKTNLRLQYPLLIEEFTILSNQNIDGINPYEDNKSTKEYYERAKSAFSRAVLLDEKYTLSHLNLACVTHLIQLIDKNVINQEKRNHYLEIYKLNKGNEEYYYLMKAIIDYDEGRIDGAKVAIKKAKTKNTNALIRANDCIINGQDCEILKKGLELQPIDFKQQGQSKSKSVWVQGINYFAEVHTISNNDLSNNYYLQFQIKTKENKYYWEQRKYEVQEIKGFSKDEIETKMGQPDLIILTKEHEIYLYQGSQLLLFFIGESQEKYHYRYRIIQE